jgi:hypothetical protein
MCGAKGRRSALQAERKSDEGAVRSVGLGFPMRTALGVGAGVGFRCFQNDLIGYVAARQQHIGLTAPVFPVKIVNVRYGEYLHLLWTSE